MPYIIAIENSESQRRQLSETLNSLAEKGWPLTAKYEAQTFGTWQLLFENAITPGLFTQREAIVIEDSESLGEFPDKLSTLIEDDKADCIMILVFSNDTKTLKPIKDKIRIIKPEAQIPPWKRKDWLITLAKSEGFKLAPDASQLLADTIESQEELRSEIHKLALYSQGRDINIHDIESLSFDEGGRAQIIFLDGVCDNKPHDVLRSLKYLRDNPLMITLTAITNRLRPALIISCFKKNSEEALKTTGARDYAIKKARAALKNFGENAIKKFMAKAARLSLLEKTNHSEGWQGFELILWELMTKK
jgi:DNA polymerase-3 subunit delta